MSKAAFACVQTLLLLWAASSVMPPVLIHMPDCSARLSHSDRTIFTQIQSFSASVKFISPMYSQPMSPSSLEAALYTCAAAPSAYRLTPRKMRKQLAANPLFCIPITTNLEPALPRRVVTRVDGKTQPSPIYARLGRAVYQCYQHAQSSRLEAPSSAEESGCVREAD